MNFGKSKSKFRRKSTNFTGIEKWRSLIRSKSRYDNNFLDDTSDSEVLQNSDIETNWQEVFFGKKRGSVDKTDDTEVVLSKKQTLILATLVPDELILLNKFTNASPKRYVGVVLMADVSGYTALSERYNNAGKSGTYRLTATLNTYLGSLIEIIYNHGGDVVKFAGDAFLAHWKTDKSAYLGHTIHAVIACALLIQHCYSSYETDVKVSLKVKLAISAGNLIFSPIGKGIDMSYVIYGLPVLEAKMAESLCTSGEVKVAPSAWGHCYTRNYDYILHDDGHVTVKCILYDPRDCDVCKPFQGIVTLIKPIKMPFTAIENMPDTIWESNASLITAKDMDLLNLRKIILTSKERNIGSEIRKFMIRPVLTQVDANQPLEYLTEMRQVTILFVTLKPKACPFTQLLTIVNNTYEIICEIVYKSMGCVNKIILFDKDVMVLVVFGLRGFKHESDAQAALKCAYGIKKTVAALDGVQEVSIGVTTGQVYSGVVGHPLRREFTVIGAIVNKAARLMCGFRNKITCDEATFSNSKMSSNSFSLQPRTELKGINRPGKIFEYTEEIRVRQLYDIEIIPPLLNRREELDIYENWLDDIKKRKNTEYDALLLIGESRIGKTRTLEWMLRHAKTAGLQTCTINLTSIHSATPYLAVSQIINHIFCLEEPLKEFEKEERIVQLLNYYSEDLCYLNEILKVKFAYNESLNAVEEQIKNEKRNTIFLQLIKSFQGTRFVFIDNIQSLDATSWDLIAIMLTSPNMFGVFTVMKGKFSSLHIWMQEIFDNNRIRKILLKPLHSHWIAPLACQILDVKSVSNNLCNALRTMWKGIPGLAETFLIHLFSSGALDLQKVELEEVENIKTGDFQFPEESYLHPMALNAIDQETLDENIANEPQNLVSVCKVTKKGELNTNINEQNLDALIMVQLDCLTPYQQMLLKMASVIGYVFTRELLENIMYDDSDSFTTARAIKRLFTLKILSCASGSRDAKTKKVDVADSTITIESNSNLECACDFEHDPEECGNLPKYAFCKLMKFRHRNTRKTCYELLPANQKKEFHTRVIYFLENHRHKCTNCGGKILVVPNPVSDSTDLNKTDEVEELAFDYVNEESSTSESFSVSQLGQQNPDEKDQEAIASIDGDDYSKQQFTNMINSVRGSSRSEPSISTSYDSLKRQKQRNSLMSISDEESINYERRFNKRVTIFYQSNHFMKNIATELPTTRIFDNFRPIVQASNMDWENLGVVDSVIMDNAQKKQNHCLVIKLESKLSQTDFSKCTCADLNLLVYEQLVYHATQAEMKVKSLEFLIHYAYLNVLSTDPYDTLPKLEEAESYCMDKQLQDILSSLERRRYLARIYALRASANLLLNNLHSAKVNIDYALKLYDKSDHKMAEILRIRSKYRNIESLMKADWVYCLNVAAIVYTTLEDDKNARYYTIKALKLIQKYDCNVIDICDTLSNAVQIELSRGVSDTIKEIEQIGAEAISRKETKIKLEELWAIGKLFTTKFHARICRNNLGGAISMGYKAVSVSRFLRADSITLEIMPELFYVLLARRQIPLAIEVVQDVIAISKERPDPSCETWYYGLCMDLILDAGIQLETVNEINRYGEYVLTQPNTDTDAARRLIVNLWTYWLRADMDHYARKFESAALKWKNQIEEDGSLTSLLSGLRLAEAMLESLARKVDDLKKVVDLMELRSLADRELTKLEQDAKLCRTILPRWLHHKAISYSLSGRFGLATAEFNKARDEARKCKNLLEEALVLASISDSKLWVKSAENGIFKVYTAAEEDIKQSWYKLLYKTTTTRTIHW